jgi:hypothetical protein
MTWKLVSDEEHNFYGADDTLALRSFSSAVSLT